jgi:hypothetical protein
LDDGGYHHTHFTGFMLKEEIVTSFWGSTSKIIGDTNQNTLNTQLNTQTNFQVPICKNIDARFAECRADYKWKKINSRLIR